LKQQRFIFLNCNNKIKLENGKLNDTIWVSVVTKMHDFENE